MLFTNWAYISMNCDPAAVASEIQPAGAVKEPFIIATAIPLIWETEVGVEVKFKPDKVASMLPPVVDWLIAKNRIENALVENDNGTD